jgi:hypothetical protein
VQCSKDYSNFTRRVSTVNIHGNLVSAAFHVSAITADPIVRQDFVVPWDGDVLLGFPAVPDDFSAWGARNNCTGSPVQTFKKGAYSDLKYESCADDTVVQLVKHELGGHE